MKHKDLQANLIAFALSLCLGFASVACMLTGYHLRAEPAVLFLLCLLLSALYTCVFCSRHRGWLSLGLGGLALLLVIFNQTFQEQTISMVSIICKVFAKAYHLPTPDFPLYFFRPDHLLPLLVIHSIISFTSTWVLLHRKSVIWAAIPSIFALSTCFLTLDSMPKTPYILLWLFAFILILLTQLVRQQNSFQGIRLTKLLALPLALVLALMLVLIPSDGSTVPDIPKWDISKLWSGDPFGSGGGQSDVETPAPPSDTLQLDNLGPRNNKGTPVMEVTAHYTGKIYLRAQDFDIYDRTAWNASADREENDMTVPSRWVNINGTVVIQPYTYYDYLYLPTYTYDAPTLVGGAAPNTQALNKYSFGCISISEHWVDQWRAGIRIPSREVDPRYLALPDSTTADAQVILEKIPGLIAADVPGKAQLIYEYVRHIVPYDQNTAAMPANETDFAIWFLQDATTGYCVHYATAATVLLRTAGIPARYVEGYSINGVQNKAVTVTDVEAHAWVEYYVDGAGWILMDPTNASSNPTPPQPTNPTTQPTTKPSTPPTTVPPATTNPAVTSKPAGTTVPPSSGPTQSSPEIASMAGWLIWLLIGAACAVAVTGILFGQYVIRRKLKKRRLCRGVSNEQASLRYKEAIRLAAFSDLPIPDALTSLAEKAKFSQYTLTEAELATFDTFFVDCADAMRNQHPLRRFYLRFLRAAY